MTHEEMSAVVHAYIEAFNQSDAQAALALYAPDAEVEDPVGTPAKKGHAAILEFYQHSMATGAKLSLEGSIRTVPGIAAWAFSAHLEYEGKKSRVEVIDLFHFAADGKIQKMQAFFGPHNFVPA